MICRMCGTIYKMKKGVCENVPLAVAQHCGTAYPAVYKNFIGFCFVGLAYPLHCYAQVDDGGGFCYGEFLIL